MKQVTKWLSNGALFIGLPMIFLMYLWMFLTAGPLGGFLVFLITVIALLALEWISRRKKESTPEEP
jgi:hypothetical protein